MYLYFPFLLQKKNVNFRLQEACPDVCGRRCRRRIRSCHGPYHLACSGQGKAEDFDNCPALNNPTTSFQRSTSTFNFELYSTIPTTLEDQGKDHLLLR